MNNSDLHYLVGNDNLTRNSQVPFSPISCNFLVALSTDLRNSEETERYPDILAFSFWCRRANLNKLQRDYDDARSRLGRGIVFHITPSNVPVNFAYSFAFGLISGNSNIVKIPSKKYPQVDIICRSINHLFTLDRFTEIKNTTTFVRYDSHDTHTNTFSSICDARIIWGGDATIEQVRKTPTPTRSIDVTFSDRYSMSILDGGSVNELNKKQLIRLSERFYNDAYQLDQNACSSPHLIVWINDNNNSAKTKFWNQLYSVSEQRYDLTETKALNKFSRLCQNAIEYDNLTTLTNHNNYIYRLGVKTLIKNMDNLRGTCGYFFEYDTKNFCDLAQIVNGKYQTLTYFGIKKSELLEFVQKNGLMGIDRIVPVGMALDIGIIWDGYDVIKSLSRVIDTI